MTSKSRQATFYEVHLNAQSEVMISLRAEEGLPESPKILYDGGLHALFYRRPSQTVVLDYLHPEVRSALKSAEKVLIAEVANAKIVREYDAPLKAVKSVPLDPAQLDPLLLKGEAELLDERELYHPAPAKPRGA